MGWMRLAWLVCTCCLLPATAQGQSIDRKFRLGMGVNLFSFVDYTLEPERAGVSTDYRRVGFGSLPSGSVAIGLGLSRHILLGLDASLTHTSEETNNQGATKETNLLLLPNLAYVFGSGDVRPFLGAGLGYMRWNRTTDALELSGNMLLLAARFGMHGFITSSVSIDPVLTFAYATGSGQTDVRVSGVRAGTQADISGVIVQLGLLVSAWF
jgi:hypothetical protein